MSYYREERGSRRGRDDYDDDRRYSRGMPERDEQGRFMSEGGSRSHSRNDDEDDRYSRRSMGRDRDLGGTGRRGSLQPPQRPVRGTWPGRMVRRFRGPFRSFPPRVG